MEETTASSAVTSETTAVYVKTTAPTQTGITALVASQEKTSTLNTTEEDPSVTAQLSLTTDQTIEVQFESLVVNAGNNFSLYCSSPVETIFRWGYSSLDSGSAGMLIIYNGQKINRKHALGEKVSVSNCGDRNCTFNVDDFQLEDAGLFTCVLPEVKQYWSITILGKYTSKGE